MALRMSPVVVDLTSCRDQRHGVFRKSRRGVPSAISGHIFQHAACWPARHTSETSRTALATCEEATELADEGIRDPTPMHSTCRPRRRSLRGLPVRRTLQRTSRRRGPGSSSPRLPERARRRHDPAAGPRTRNWS
ncbi:hypothetical protein ACRAWF_26925 [Streptomyces sp. L7]